MQFFTSDSHFGHKNMLLFERFGFDTIEDHDSFILNVWETALSRAKDSDVFYFLGDLGSKNTACLSALDAVREAKCKTVAIRGNHDSENMEVMGESFDEVYDYPLWVSNKICLSHYPVAMYDDSLNIHGHLHGQKLSDPNHLNVSIAVAGYNVFSDKQVQTACGRLPKFTRKFLSEPYVGETIVTIPNDDWIIDSRGRLDVSATRLKYTLEGKWRKKS